MNSAHFANFALTAPPQLANLGNPASAIGDKEEIDFGCEIGPPVNLLGQLSGKLSE
jgi:hypothetical protein